MKHFKKIAFLILLLFVVRFYSCEIRLKPSIRYATIEQLDNVPGIGEKLSTEIYLFVNEYDIDRVNELKGVIPELGEKRIQALKEVYK